MNRESLAVVVLAAGMGTRMNSKRQKILHEVGGKPMVTHVYEAATAVSARPPVLVIGQGGEHVRALFGDTAEYVVQEEKLGTGHATLMAADLLRGQAAQVVVLYGDMPLLKADTIRALAARQAESGTAVAMLSVMGEPESSFGRVVRDENGIVQEIVEVSEAKRRENSRALLDIRELNVGVYCFSADFLWAELPHLPQHVARNGNIEYYLTDMVGTAVAKHLGVEAVLLDDEDECLGAGTRAELVAVEQAFRRRANHRWLAAGVTLIDPASTFIDPDVTIGQDTVIWPNSFLQGNTAVGANCTIGPNAIVRHSRLGDGVTVVQAVIENRLVAADTVVPPFTHLTG